MGAEGWEESVVGLNPFTAPACEMSKLKDAGTRLQTLSIFSGPITQLLSVLCVVVRVPSYASAEKKTKGLNNNNNNNNIMYIYHALINALSAHAIHINLNTIFYTHVEHSPTKTIYIKYYTKTNTEKTHYKHIHTHTHRVTVAETGY